jgi:iron(III) transport system permease protein
VAHTIWGRSPSRTLVLGLSFATLIVGCVMPLVWMFVLALRESSTQVAQVASPVAALLLDARQRGLLWNTACLGAGAALGATLVGVPLGVALARVPMPFKAFARVCLTLPLVLPPSVAALAWTYAAGRTGAWTSFLPTAIAVLSLVLYPLSMLATEAAVRRIDAGLEEAALMVTRPGAVLRRITLPLAGPSILAAALVVFVLAVSDFGVPAVLGVRVFTTEVFTAFAALYDFSRAAILTLPLLGLCVLVAAVAVFVAGDRLVTTRRSLKRASPLMFPSWSPSALVATLSVIILALVLPIGVLVAEAWTARSTLAVVQGSRDAIIGSLMWSAAAASIVVACAAGVGYARAHLRKGTGRAIDVLLLALFAVPSTVVGIGLIGVWNRQGPLGMVYGTPVMLLLADVARFLPVAALIIGASVRQLPVSHEEAAAVSGAGWLRTARLIVWPQIRPGLLAAWVIAFVLSFGELGASILVAPPGESTLPVRVYTLIANTPSSHVATLALLQAAVACGPLAIVGLVLSMREGNR